MTKRRPSNKKPSGVNRSLGNCLTNHREKVRKSHQHGKWDGDIENAAFLEQESKKVVDSITEETGLDEFLAKAELAGTEFTAEREAVRIIEKETSIVIPSRKDFEKNLELQAEHEHLLKIPRRPKRDLWETVEELNKLENKVFLDWRHDLADLSEIDGLALTPFERNPEMWKELWRVVERSDIVVQIVDARNPMLFRSKDLEAYVKEVDPVKQNLLIVNKSDLLLPSQILSWAEYFKTNDINAVFWSAVDEVSVVAEELEDVNIDDDEEEADFQLPSTSTGLTQNYDGIVFIRCKEDLITFLKEMGHIRSIPGEKQLIVGMVGYPNVGKSSTINKIIGEKKVSVSATPGKTRHFQTIHVDRELCLCDCPGLVMPSFSFGRNEMFLNGIMPVDQMREHFGPTSLLLSRVPLSFIEDTYSVMLPQRDTPSAVEVLTAIAFMRGFMSSSGIPDCSRAARLLIKDVVNGKVLWVAAPPGKDQHEFDKLVYPEERVNKKCGFVQLQQLEKRGLIEGDAVLNRRLDNNFFDGENATAHVKTGRGISDVRAGIVSDIPSNTSIPSAPEFGNKKHHNRNKKEKLRRIYVGTYA